MCANTQNDKKQERENGGQSTTPKILRVRVPRTASKWTVRSIAGGKKVELSRADRKPEKMRYPLVAYVYFHNSGEAVAAKKKLEWTVWNGVSMCPEMWIDEENETDAQYR